MLEIVILSIIVLAVGYWTALWLMGRHDDVLHGDFVREESGPETAYPSSPAYPSLPAPRANNTEALQSLLNAIKRDLSDAAQR